MNPHNFFLVVFEKPYIFTSIMNRTIDYKKSGFNFFGVKLEIILISEFSNV